MRRLFITFLLLAVLPTAGCGSLIVTEMSPDELRHRRGFAWTAIEDDEFLVFAEAGSMSAASMDHVTEVAVAAKASVLSALELPTYQPQIHVFIVESRDRMRDLIGRRTNATGFHSTQALCLVWRRTGVSGLEHEMVHVIAMNAWGVPERWVNEGLAVDVTGPWLGQDVDSVCHVLRGRDELPSLNELTQGFNRLPSAVSYPAAGSFVRFVRKTYGLAAVRAIWSDGRRSVPAHTGRSWNELEAAWLDRIDRASTDGMEYEPSAVTPANDRG